MDPEQSELASTSLATFNQHLGDHYRELSSNLNSSLSGSAVTTPAEAIKNKQIIDAIVGLFPNYYDEGIKAESAAEVRWLQSSVVVLEDVLGSAIPPPYYVIGHKNSGSTASLLLHGVPRQSYISSEPQRAGEIREVPLWKRAYSKHARLMESKPTEVLDEAEVSRHLSSRSYYVGNSAPDGLTRINTFGLLFRARALVFRTLATKEILPRLPSLKGLSDETLGRYHVFDHINHLATAFGKVAEAQSIIQSNTPRPTSVQEPTVHV